MAPALVNPGQAEAAAANLAIPVPEQSVCIFFTISSLLFVCVTPASFPLTNTAGFSDSAKLHHKTSGDGGSSRWTDSHPQRQRFYFPRITQQTAIRLSRRRLRQSTDAAAKPTSKTQPTSRRRPAAKPEVKSIPRQHSLVTSVSIIGLLMLLARPEQIHTRDPSPQSHE